MTASNSLSKAGALSSLLLLAVPACPGGGAETGETGTETDTGGMTTDDPPTGGPSLEEEPPGEVVKSDKPRNTMPDISADELAAMAADERAFALSLIAALPVTAGNRAVSPTSIRLAFGQTYAGARTISKSEIETALKFGPDPEKTHAGFNHVDLELEARNLPSSGENDGDDSVVLTLVNQVFGRPSVTWEPAFLGELAESYGAAMHLLDFTDSEPSRMAINQWVNDVTQDKIPELLPFGAISVETTTVLINALYLKAPWNAAFEGVNEQGTFNLLDASTTTTAMMSGLQEGARHFIGAGYEAAEVPLRGDELTMVFIVPEAGTFEQFSGALDGPALGEIFDALVPTSLNVTIPRFKFFSDVPLNDPLKALGLVSSFELGLADFSGMSPAGKDWAISGVYHNVFISVDEKGVEAAAATAVVIFDSGGPGPEASFIADRPFLFAIRDRGTDSLLFFGSVVDPSK